MRNTFLAALLFSPLVIQGLPDGESLLRKMRDAGEKRESIEYTMDVTVEATQGGQRVASQSGRRAITVAFTKPGKLFIEEQASSGARTQTFDGNFTWIYDSTRKQYMKVASGPRLTVLGI